MPEDLLTLSRSRHDAAGATHGRHAMEPSRILGIPKASTADVRSFAERYIK